MGFKATVYAKTRYWSRALNVISRNTAYSVSVSTSSVMGLSSRISFRTILSTAHLVGAEIAAMQPLSERGTSFVDNSEGGVRLNPMDDDTPYGHLTARSLSRTEESDLSHVNSTAASGGTERPTFDADLPAISESVGKGNALEGGVIEGSQALRVDSSNSVVSGKQAWASKLFPGAKPTPVTGGWTATTTPNYHMSIAPSEAVDSEYRIRTSSDIINSAPGGPDDLFRQLFQENDKWPQLALDHYRPRKKST